MGLQKFIEDNIRKLYGDKYLYENFVISTRYCRATNLHTVEAVFCLPWGWSFRNCFDDREIKDNIDFYKWLTKSFFPLVKKRIERTEKGN